jgi:hypothetical protein
MALKKTARPQCALLLLVFIVGACANEPSLPEIDPPNVAPVSHRPAATLRLDNSRIDPMYRQVLAIDLENVARVANLDNTDILKARAARHPPVFAQILGSGLSAEIFWKRHWLPRDLIRHHQYSRVEMGYNARTAENCVRKLSVRSMPYWRYGFLTAAPGRLRFWRNDICRPEMRLWSPKAARAALQ